jgi:hypothetical protein
MKPEPSRQAPDRPPEVEAWKIIFSAFAVSGSLVIGWTLFVLFTDPTPRPARVVGTPGEMGQSWKPASPVKP